MFGSIRSQLTLMSAAALLIHASGASAATHGVAVENYEGRSLIVYVPSRLPAPGTRALVVVLHGGLGNAQRIESGQSENGLNMDTVAEKTGFIVAYLNGTPVTRRFGADMLGWNAGGGCCGQPAEKNVDDVGYIQSVVEHLAGQYGVDQSRIYGMGHSNGGMMTQRVMCETGIYAAAVSISGPLNFEGANCSAARGKRILAIHGTEDENVPIAGGRGTKGISGATYNSEERTRLIFISSGASYNLLVVKGADHKLDHIEDAIRQTEGVSIAEKVSQYFGLLDQSRRLPGSVDGWRWLYGCRPCDPPGGEEPFGCPGSRGFIHSDDLAGKRARLQLLGEGADA
jgi:polyhydroxybutyrate depolymerase